MAFEPDSYDNQALAPLSTLSTLKHIPFSFSRKTSLVFPSFSMPIDTIQLPSSHAPNKSLQFPNIPVFNVLPNHCIAVPFKQNYLRNGFTCDFYRNYPGKAILGK